MSVRYRVRLWLCGVALAFSVVSIQLGRDMARVAGLRQSMNAAAADLAALSRFDAQLAAGMGVQPSDPGWASWNASAGPSREHVDLARNWLDRIDQIVLGNAVDERSSDLRWYVRKAASELRAAAAVTSATTASSWHDMSRGLLMAYILLFAGAAGWYVLGTAPSNGITVVTTPASAMWNRDRGAAVMPGSEFAHVRHELRTPLTVMIGYASELQNLLAEEELRSFASHIVDSGKKLHAALEELLSFAEYAADEGPERSEPVQVQDIVESVIRQLRPLAYEKQLHFVYRSTPGDARVRVGEDSLRSAIQHLVQNAIKFTENGSVTVAVEADGPTVRIVVEDTGQGFDDTRLSELSEPFVQGSSGDARQHGGLGLGLTIARRVAENGGGRLTASSVPGSGSRFAITFPRHTQSVRRAA